MKLGFRTFTAEGLNLERMLRRAAEQGIRISAICRESPRKLTARTRERDTARLQQLAQEGGWRFIPGKRTGVGAFIERCRRRWLLTACLLICTLLVAVGTTFIWEIRIVNAGTYEADIRCALAEMNIRIPMPKGAVDLESLRASLEWRYPHVAWIECGWRGMTLTIRVVEGVLPLEDGQQDGSCNVVAARDGIVDSIVTRAGTPVVAVGDFVRKGQVLIRGEERTANGETRAVAARGSVIARVWEAASVRMPIWETETAYTGRTQTVWTLRSPWFDLWQMQKSEFDTQDVAVREIPLGGFFIPLILHTETRMEAQCTRVARDIAQVREDSARAALQLLYKKVGGKESLVDNWVNWSIIEDEILLSVAYGECLMDVAQQERTSVMAAAD